MKLKKFTALFLTAFLTVGALAGCGNSNNNSNNSSETQTQNNVTEENKVENSEKTNINIAVLKGPTGIGAVKLMEDDEKGTCDNDYNFTIVASPDEINAKIINGEVDIAAVPTNLGAVLYNKTEGEVELAALNTLGVLYVVEKGDTIKFINDLSGKSIVASGKGSVPEYAINYILEKNRITDVNIDYKTEHAEAVTALTSGDATIALIPEPNVTAALAADPELRIALNITDEWNKVSDGSVLSMGGIIARKDFIDNNKEAFDNFLYEYEDSIEFVNENSDEASQLVAKYGIMPKAELALKAIPNCNIVYIDDEEMKNSIEGFYEVLYSYEPKSVGGKLPDENFYYISE